MDLLRLWVKDRSKRGNSCYTDANQMFVIHLRAAIISLISNYDFILHGNYYYTEADQMFDVYSRAATTSLILNYLYILFG